MCCVHFGGVFWQFFVLEQCATRHIHLFLSGLTKRGFEISRYFLINKNMLQSPSRYPNGTLPQACSLQEYAPFFLFQFFSRVIFPP